MSIDHKTILQIAKTKCQKKILKSTHSSAHPYFRYPLVLYKENGVALNGVCDKKIHNLCFLRS